MKDIFSDIYDRVLSFFTSSSTQDESKSLAKNRLKSVLAQDRVGFSERAVQMLKDNMIEVISKYLEIDVESFDLSLDANEENTILNFSIPVIRPKTDEEIDEALALENQKNLEKTEEIVGELKELVKEKAQELAQNINDEANGEESEEQNEEEIKEEDKEEEQEKEDSENNEPEEDSENEEDEEVIEEDETSQTSDETTETSQPQQQNEQYKNKKKKKKH